MGAIEEAALATGVVLLVGGFAYAAYADLKEREVTDALWQGLGLGGLVVGAASVASGGATPVAVWLLVSLLTLEHMFAWDERLGRRLQRHADLLELAGYVVVVGVVAAASLRLGVGPSGVPVAAIAVLVSVVFARVLFEAGLLYGGADAKALMIASLLVPLFPSPLVPASGPLATVPTYLPFSIDLLTNAALLSLVVPLGIGIRNLLRREFASFPAGFTGYLLDVAELPRRFVWVRDPSAPEAAEAEDVETSAEDRQHRVELARELSARGVRRVWVTPQIPFLVLMAAGAFSALVVGNLALAVVQWL